MTIYELKAQYIKVGEVDSQSITHSKHIAEYLAGAFDEYRDQEQFWVICLNGANLPICRRMVTLGLVNQAQVHPREVFKVAVAVSAVSVILAHNHPSGNLKPSDEDINVTKKLVAAGNLLEIPVLDHLVLTNDMRWASLRNSHPSIF